MGKKIAYILAAVLLALMARTLVKAAAEDSATSDEVVHATAGYTYVKTLDYRLNPEHPPLVKDLAGLLISTMPLNYPFKYFYSDDVDQYRNAYAFFYESGNDADAILFRGRLAVVAIAIILGLFVFAWSAELNGLAAGLFSLLLLAFDPNILAHGHLITQDAAISAAVVVNLYFVWKYLQKPSALLLCAAGLTFGIALVTKFSAPLLLIAYVALVIYLSSVDRPLAGFVDRYSPLRATKTTAISLASKALPFAIIAAIGSAVVFLVYSINMLNMPVDAQKTLIENSLPAKAPTISSLAGTTFRPFAQYALGFHMVGNHVSVGQKIYLLGDLSRGARYYYPLVFAIKSTIPALVLMLLALAFGRGLRSKSRIGEVALLSGAIAFPIAATLGNLDLGVRYILPFYPLFYIYAGKLVKLFRIESLGRHFGGRFRPGRAALTIAIATLAIWQIATASRIAPFYVSYFNEFVGPERGGMIVSDSNVDWGQDLKRLKKYADDKRIEHLYIDYFGGGHIGYYFGRKATRWSPVKPGKPKGWFAISLNNYTRYTAGGKYRWLLRDKPIDRIGYSILVYYLR